MIIGLSAKDVSLVDASVLTRWTITPKLLGVPGVANVATWGMRSRQLQVQVNSERLKNKGVSLKQIVKSAGDAMWVSPLTYLESSTLGAGGWMTFFRVTLPSIRWGLLYGVILCNARAMGEFGAVAVVSGHIRGLTTTMPLQAQVLYDEYDLVGAFAVASLLMLLALLTLIVKSVVEALGARRRRA